MEKPPLTEAEIQQTAELLRSEAVGRLAENIAFPADPVTISACKPNRQPCQPEKAKSKPLVVVDESESLFNVLLPTETSRIRFKATLCGMSAALVLFLFQLWIKS